MNSHVDGGGRLSHVLFVVFYISVSANALSL